MGTNIVKKSASIIKVSAEKVGSNVSMIAKKSAPAVQKGLEGIFDTLKNTASYTMSTAKNAAQGIVASRKTRKARKARK
jgi:hypothetical protein